MCESTFQPMNAYLSLLRSLTMNHNTLHTADACFVAVGSEKPEICGFRWRCSIQPLHWWLEVGGLGNFTRWVLPTLNFIIFYHPSEQVHDVWAIRFNVTSFGRWFQQPQMMIPVEFHVYKAILTPSHGNNKRLSHVVLSFFILDFRCL